MRPLLLLSALVLTACGSDTPGGDSGAPSASAEAVVADVAPCDLLTPYAVAGATGLPVSAVVLNEEAIGMGLVDADTHCMYTLPEGDYDSAALILRALDSADAAETTFAGQYRTMTEAELDRVAVEGDRAAAEMVADGELDAGAIDAGSTLSNVASKFTFESVDGVGDQAVVETNHIMDPAVPTTVHVRDGAMIYSIELSSSFALMRSDGGAERIRETLVALGRGVAGR